MKIFIFPCPQIKHESCFCQIIKENLYPSMQTQQSKISVLQEQSCRSTACFYSVYTLSDEKGEAPYHAS